MHVPEIPHLSAADPELAGLIEGEAQRQHDKLRLIPSENYVSPAVLEATGSVLTNKYSEGYAGRRYYEGQQFIDQIEQLAVERARSLFGVDHANIQPYSGSPAASTSSLAAPTTTCCSSTSPPRASRARSPRRRWIGRGSRSTTTPSLTTHASRSTRQGSGSARRP